MHHRLITRPRLAGLVLAAALSALLTASALAAHPEAGRSYAGFTSAPAYHTYKAPVGFKVSANGKQLLGFQYAAFCGVGGFGGPGDAWTGSYFTIKVGAIPLDKQGNFSVKGVKWSVTVPVPPPHPASKTATSAVSGHFQSAGSAAGTIKFTQSYGKARCGATLTFAATAS